MSDTDFYKVLGVSREASADEIRKAYKKLARENHPDMKPNDKAAAEKFKQTQEAYSVLSDSEKRDQYDRYGTAFGEGGPQQWSTGQESPIDLGDLFGGGGFDFGDLFGGAGGFGGRSTRTAAPRKGENRRAEISVPFQVAVEGGGYDMSLTRGGRVEHLAVKIPPGVSDGGVIRLAGEGEPGLHGGPAGDFLVTLSVAPHPYFRREGKNLVVEVPVTLTEAALGAKVEVPTLTEGPVVLTVPPGASSGTKLRLRGKGVPDPKTKQRGDQFVVIKIAVAGDLSDRAKQLLQELGDEITDNPRAGLW